VENAPVEFEAESHPRRFLYAPSTKGESTAARDTSPSRTEGREPSCRRYSRRWQLGTGYRSTNRDYLEGPGENVSPRVRGVTLVESLPTPSEISSAVSPERVSERPKEDIRLDSTVERQPFCPTRTLCW